MADKQVIVVGGGLAGLSAAHTVLQRGGRVVVIDKMAFMGGNSTKATSGINGTYTRAQKAAGVADSPEIFEADTTKSAGHRAQPPLIKTLTHESAPAVEWLVDSFGLDLSKLSRLGGHSNPRTHRGAEKFPGFAITYAMIEKFEQACAVPGGPAQYIPKGRVVDLLKSPAGEVVGVVYEKEGQRHEVRGSVVMATGGYGADYTKDSLMMKFRPDLAPLPTTNGEHCTGDGVKLGLAAGADVIDMEFVQVHPTGLVFPKEPHAKVLFLAAEALRGCGGILLNREGQRFVDELGLRDYVTGRMNADKPPYRLVLNGAAAKEISWHCKHYCGRGVMERFESGAAVAAAMGIPASTLAETFAKYSAAAKAGKPDEFGKKFFNNAPFVMGDVYHVSIVTPVVHYTMGGLRVAPSTEVLTKSGAPLPGLFAAGEVMGGVHGKNRMGGNSLLDCVVFGRIAGVQALEKYPASLAAQASPSDRLSTVLSHLGVPIEITIRIGGSAPTSAALAPAIAAAACAPSSRPHAIHPDDPAAAKPAAAGAPAPAPAPAAATSAPAAAAAAPAPAAPAAAKGAGPRVISKAEVALHNKENDCWVIVNDRVLDVTNFMPDHPGGKKAILVFAGKDASEEFNMLHNPNVIEKYLEPSCILGVIEK